MLHAAGCDVFVKEPVGVQVQHADVLEAGLVYLLEESDDPLVGVLESQVVVAGLAGGDLDEKRRIADPDLYAKRPGLPVDLVPGNVTFVLSGELFKLKEIVGFDRGELPHGGCSFL